MPGAVIAVQTFGDYLNFNPHLHIIATDGCFYDQDGFMVGPQPDPKALEHAFRLEVFKLLNKKARSQMPLSIQKVYSRDPLICPKCKGKMKVIALIDDVDVIKKILQHLD